MPHMRFAVVFTRPNPCALHPPAWSRYDLLISQTRTERVVSKADVCGGKPCIAGTRIRVQDVYVWHDLQGASADELVSSFPHLTMADVYARYWDHRDEILRQMQDESAFVEQMKQKNSSLLKHHQ